MRIGNGYDAHRLAANRALVIGGVSIAHPLGLAGHSDGDVLLHAICDACLGAAGRGDIGRFFPSDDAKYKDVDSRILLREVAEILAGDGWKIGNLDAVIVAEKPKLALHIPEMCANIAADLAVKKSQINLKATTTDGMGFCGNEQGIAAHAVVIITQK